MVQHSRWNPQCTLNRLQQASSTQCRKKKHRIARESVRHHQQLQTDLWKRNRRGSWGLIPSKFLRRKLYHEKIPNASGTNQAQTHHKTYHYRSFQFFPFTFHHSILLRSVPEIITHERLCAASLFFVCNRFYRLKSCNVYVIIVLRSINSRQRK